MIRFLIDECLSRRLVTVARDQGYEANHVLMAGLASTPDSLIATRARTQDDIFVTNNARDYRRLYAKFLSHPGLVIIMPSVRFPEQMKLFGDVIACIEQQPTTVDQLVVVRRDGAITIEPWPRPR